MARRYTTNQRAEFFNAWVQVQSVAYVAKTCSISHTTARKYRFADNWDKRLKSIQKQASAKVDKGLVRQTAHNIKIVRAFIGMLSKTLTPDERKKFKSKSTIGDLDKLFRLEAFLRGQPDSRPDLSSLHDMPTEDLLAELKRLEG